MGQSQSSFIQRSLSNERDTFPGRNNSDGGSSTIQSEQQQIIDSMGKRDTENATLFNNYYEILKLISKGKSSRVYLCRQLIGPPKLVALKVIQEDYLEKEKDAMKTVDHEMKILQSISHPGVVALYECGKEGVVKKPSGKQLTDLVYLVLEYVPRGHLFDVCEKCGGLGEDAGRFFITQLLDALEYLHDQNIVHRDIKLENILIDQDLNLKLADFGFATNQKIHELTSYRGTFTYMAPEIKEFHAYDGRAADVFSLGVILFILVIGFFPFKEARRDEYYYNLIYMDETELYWSKIQQGQRSKLSREFKDLVVQMFSHDPSDRPSLKQIRASPWLSKPFDKEHIRQSINDQLSGKKKKSSKAG